MGRIEEINMKDTIIRTFDFRRVVVPNAKFVTSAIKTFSLESVLRLEIDLSVSINQDIDKLLDVTKEHVDKQDFVSFKEYTQVFVDSFNEKTCNIKIEFCFNPNAGIPTDMMKSKIQAGLIKLYSVCAESPFSSLCLRKKCSFTLVNCAFLSLCKPRN